MLWRKSWLDTRWRFGLGLALLLLLACGTVFDYQVVLRLQPMVRHARVAIDPNAAAGVTGVQRALADAIEVESTYRGFIWFQWFRQNLAQTITLLAVLLGSGGLLGGSMRFTMSLPVSRRAVLVSRAAVASGELFLLALVPTMVVVIVSPAIGEHYSVVDAAIHGGCAFAGATTFLFGALLLSTVFADVWRPLLITCAAAVALAIAGHAVPALGGYSVLGAIVAESYFRAGALPWPALVVSVIVSAILFGTATINFAHRDF